MSDVAPGWYADPTNPLQERLWDGSEWVDNVRPKPPAATAPSRHDMVASAHRPVLDLASKSSQTRRISGVTQTLIALAVIGILAAIAVPAFSAVTDNSSTTTDNSSDQGVYAIGDVGPGGGRVFITPSTKGNNTGQYYEAAPYADEVEANWCSSTSMLLGASGTAIGTGQSNTTTADATCTSGAIQIASDYANNGFSDWFLPSKDELNELCKYAHKPEGQTSCGGDTPRTGFSTGLYWSSSEKHEFSAWFQYFLNGNQFNDDKDYNALYVRPVRSFS